MIEPTMTTSPLTSTNSVASLHDAFEFLCRSGALDDLLAAASLRRHWIKAERDFAAFAHPHQRPPLAANNGGPWTTWLMLGGRGAGKTRLGAEWVRAQVAGRAPYAGRPAGAVALVGETEHD